MTGVHDPDVEGPANAVVWATEVTSAVNDHEYRITGDVRRDYDTPPTEAFYGQNDSWGEPRPDRYEWPPVVVWDLHFQLFAGTTPLPVSKTAWINALARYTVAETDTDEKAASNYFAHDPALKPLGFAYTNAIEWIQRNGFGHISVQRIDKFYGATPDAGGFATGGLVSAGITSIAPEFPYEMIARITDRRPDWYPNTAPLELSPWWKRMHMFDGSHLDTVASAWMSTIEGLGYKGRVYFDEEIVWTRRPSRQPVNGGTPWPYDPALGLDTVQYPGPNGSVKNYDSPGSNPVPENDTFDRDDFNE